MQKPVYHMWKKICSFPVVIVIFISLACCLSLKIINNARKHAREKRENILLMTKTAEIATLQGTLPPKSALPNLERAYHLGGAALQPYANFLSTCFYLHNEPLRGAYYAGLAYYNSLNIQLGNPIQALLQEIHEARTTQLYDQALDKSYSLLHMATASPECPTLHFLTLLRIIELKELLNQDTTENFKALQTLPFFHEFEQIYKEGEWTLSKRFGKKRTTTSNS
ncbi:hypothetical protein [Candidatus Chlamydia sanziniae]|nr:hypothetical protein [Candidatus Chlamydia sanziniae]